jgi:hypothetical protein
MDGDPRCAHMKRESFLLKAEEADRHAAMAKDPESREAWREIASSWRFLADQAIRISGVP